MGQHSLHQGRISVIIIDDLSEHVDDGYNLIYVANAEELGIIL